MIVWTRNNTLPQLAWLALLLVASAPAGAAIHTVGGDTDCDYGTIQQAVNALPAGGAHEIRIANSQDYDAQAIHIVGRVVTLRGGYGHCADATSSSSTVLNGEGGSQDSVLTITGTGNDVILEHLGLIRGDEVYDGYGGGIDFRGAGTLTLRTVTVYDNYAGYGGGISVNATGGAAELHLEANTYVLLNTAQFSGGGIRAEGDTRVFMLGANTWLQSNTAIGFDPQNNAYLYGYGGGIEVIGPARADISGTIIGNTARYGGGIAVVAPEISEHSDSVVRLFTTDPNNPVEVSGNRATQTGGGIWLKPDIGVNNVSYAILCAFDFRINDNRAQQGSAIYADTDSIVGVNVSSYVGLNRSLVACGAEHHTTLGAVACADVAECSAITDNIASDVIDQPTSGATILLQTDGQLVADRVAMHNNQGGQLLRTIESNSTEFSNCLFADNDVTGHLIQAEQDSSSLGLVGCTLANNTVGAAEVLSVDVEFDLALHRSILWQPGKTLLVQTGGDRDLRNMIVSERESIDGGNTPHVSVANPRFEDPAHGDYRPIAASPAVDAAAYMDEPGPDLDLDGASRGFDVPIVPNWGIADIGAYERHDTFSMVRNHGFGTDLRLWNEVTFGSATWEPVGASSAGGVLISAEPHVAGDLVGLTQCVRIPGPGVYALNGFGLGSGFGITMDTLRLHWKLRPSSPGETCTGAVTAEGDLYLPNGSSYAEPAAPALIPITQTEWTGTTTVEITTVVNENGSMVFNSTFGRFDGITLEPSGDLIFANGFDYD